MSPATLQAYVSLAGLILAIVGLPILILQIRAIQRSIRSGAHAAIYAQAADFRSHLVDHPHLRKYFFDGVEIEPDHPEYDRVVTIAELFLNEIEHITVMGDSFGSGNRPALERFARHALDSSPIMRRRLKENRAAYSDVFDRFQ
jgi:hypothetical protein